MNKPPMLKDVIEKLDKEFEEEFPNYESGYLSDKNGNVWLFNPAVNVKDLKAYLKRRDEALIARVREEEKDKCKQLYIDGCDWSEWEISDEEAADNFEEEYRKLSQEREHETNEPPYGRDIGYGLCMIDLLNYPHKAKKGKPMEAIENNQILLNLHSKEECAYIKEKVVKLLIDYRQK